MFLWYLVLACVGVWAVFDSPALDYRLVMVGAVLPVAEVALGRPGPLHSLVTAVVVLTVVMVATRGRRLVRRRLLGVPIGLFAHLVLSGIWTDTAAFWWPLTGLGLSDARPPELARGGVSLLLELVAVAIALWWMRRVGLDDAVSRERFRTTGQLPRAPGTIRGGPPVAGSC
ncbi:MAG: hypothetical protein ACSLFO_01040 [Acidimicrobiales bacterium]